MYFLFRIYQNEANVTQFFLALVWLMTFYVNFRAKGPHLETLDFAEFFFCRIFFVRDHLETLDFAEYFCPPLKSFAERGKETYWCPKYRAVETYCMALYLVSIFVPL